MANFTPRTSGCKPIPRLHLQPDFLAILAPHSFNVLSIISGYPSAQSCGHDARFGVPLTPTKIMRWQRIAAVLRYDGPIFVEPILPGTDVPGSETVTS